MNLNENSSAKLDRDLVRIALLITSITFLGVLRFEFVYDDYPQIVNNPFVKSWKFLPRYFASSVWKQTSLWQFDNYYRPIFMVWNRLNYAFFAGRPFGWHLGALALHLMVTWIVYWVIREMCGRTDLAWMTALLFGVHPIHHEVVAWVSGVTESLYGIFFLAAFLAYLRFRENAKASWMVLSCALYALSLLCKETAIVLPALVFVHSSVSDRQSEQAEAGKPSRQWAQALRFAAWYIPVALVYFPIRYYALTGFSRAKANASVYQWFLTLPSILCFYAKHWFLPVHFGESYDLFYQTKLGMTNVILPLLILIAIAAAVWMLRKRLGSREVWLAVAWIVIPLLPALDTFAFTSDELVHDRYFYIPSIGAALLVALIIVRVGSSQTAIFGQPLPGVVAGLALTVVLSICAIHETNYWRSDYALWGRAHQIAPRNGTATSNLGAELVSRGDIDAAQPLLEAGYREHNDFKIAFNLGRVYYAKKDYPAAERYTQQALELVPKFPEGYVSMAEIQLKQGQPQEAQISLRRAVELDPYSPSFHTSYGIVLALNGDCAAATQQFEAALELNPGDFFANTQLLRCQGGASPASTPASKPGQL